MISDRSQRWRERVALFRPAAEPFDPRLHHVEPIEERRARVFIEQHHYSKAFPAARLCIGLYRVIPGPRPRIVVLVGVIVFSVPPSQAVIPKWTGQRDPLLGVELGRLVILDCVEGNGETFFLCRAFALLREAITDARAVIAMSDPIERFTLDGRRVKPGHYGGIYREFSGRHVGRSKARTLLLAPDGTVISDRTASKLRGEEKGWRYAAERLAEAGAAPWLPGESGAAYWSRLLKSSLLRRMRHPGNFVWAWPLGGQCQRRATAAHLPKALPFPVEATP